MLRGAIGTTLVSLSQRLPNYLGACSHFNYFIRRIVFLFLNVNSKGLLASFVKCDSLLYEIEQRFGGQAVNTQAEFTKKIFLI